MPLDKAYATQRGYACPWDEWLRENNQFDPASPCFRPTPIETYIKEHPPEAASS